MSLPAFVKFALICFDALAWPLLALGYPLRASIRAIEANSKSDTKKLVTYWVFFSIISLFEHAFMGVLQWLPFWPYMKLTIVCWLMIPKFDGAFYVYNHFVHPCLYIDVKTITLNWFKKQWEFVFKDDFLAEAEKYVKVHGPEALEKLVASKISETEPNAAQTVNNMNTLPEIKGPILGHSPEIPSDKQVQKETEPNAVQTVNNMHTLPEIKVSIAGNPPEIPSHKQVQKEWTCAMCLVTTTSEKTLNIHFQGRRHRNACEKLEMAKNQASKGKVSFVPEDRIKHSDLPQKEPQKHASSTTTQESQKKQQPSVAKNCEVRTNNTSTSSKPVNPETVTSQSNLPKEEPKKSLPNNMAENQLKPSENVQGQQQVLNKKHPEIKIPEIRCTICNIICSRLEDFDCHLRGRKHLAQIQKLNSPVQGQLA